MSEQIIIQNDLIETRIIIDNGSGGGGGAVASVNGLIGAVILDALAVGAVPVERTISINGVELDLSANRAWVINDDTAVGTLQQVTTLGASSTNPITITDTYDSIVIQGDKIIIQPNADRAVTTNGILFMQIDAIQQGQNQVPFVFRRRSAPNPPSARNNEIFTFGFNISDGGNVMIGGVAGLGESWESGYTTDEWQEKHEWYITPEGVQKRLSSYTIKGPDEIDFYHTISNFYIHSAVDQTYVPYAMSWAQTAGNVAGNISFVFDAGAGTTYNWYYDNQGITLTSTAAAASKVMYLDQMTDIKLPGMSSYKAGGSLYNQSGHILPFLGQTNVFSLGLTDTRWLNVFTNILDAETIKVVPFAGVGDRPVGVDANGTFKIITSGGSQVNSDWNAVSGVEQILNKPSIPTQYTDELAQDAIGAMVSSEFTYADATPLLSINSISSSKITGLTSSSVGLGNVNNTSDVNKPISTAQQTLFDLKADLVGGIVPNSQLPAALVAISSHANFAALPGTGAANTIYITTDNNKRYLWSGSAYFEIVASAVTSWNTRIGDVVAVKADVGLGSVDNTSDAAKPVSTAQQTALDLKATKATTITINGTAFDLSANRSWSVGTVTGNSVVSANGFAGTFTSTSTPALTITTTITGILKGNGTAISAAIAGDFPTLNQNTTGTALNVSGTVAIGNGGTGQVTASAGFNALSPATTLGDIIYGSGANTNARLAGNTTTTKKFLTQTGSGGVSAAPVWDVITTFDVPTLNQNTTGTALNITGVLTGASFPALTGDITTTIGNLATTLATVNGNVGSFGSATQVGTFTVNAKGLITAASNTTIAIAQSAVTNLVSDLALKSPIASPTFTGTVTMPTGSATVSPLLIPAGTIRSSPADGTLEYGSSHLYFTIGSTRYQIDQQTAAGVSDGDKGDITVSGGGTVWTIDNATVTLAKMANISSQTFIGRNTAATGVPEEINTATARSIMGITNIDNTSDVNKPVSTAQQTALNLKANIASPTFTGMVTFPTGTASASTAPWKVVTGTLNTTPEAGAFEYNTGIPYFSGTASKRAIVATEHYSVIAADFTLAAASGVQACFTATHDVITLEATTTYEFEGFYILNTGATTHTTAIAFAISGSVTSVEYWCECWAGAINAVTPSNTATVWWTTHVSGVASKVINVTNINVWTMIKFKGIWRNNAAGTVTPQINFSANPTGTNLMKVGSYIKFSPKGSNTMTFVGQFA